MVDQGDDFNYEPDELLNDNNERDAYDDSQDKQKQKDNNANDIKKKNNKEEEEENYGDFEDENFNIESEHPSSKRQMTIVKEQSVKKSSNSQRNKDHIDRVIEENDNEKQSNNFNNNNNDGVLITKSLKKRESNDNIISSQDQTTVGPKEQKKSNIMIERELIPQSNIQLAEASYYVLKTELDSLLTKNTFTTAEEIAKQNQDLTNYLSQLNTILSSLISSIKVIDNKRPPQPKLNHIPSSSIKKQSKSVINTNTNSRPSSTKLVDVYKKEYLRLENRLKQLSNDEYESYLNKQLTDINAQILAYEKDNKKLKADQKKCEIDIDIQRKTSKKNELELKRLEMDYENTINQHCLLSQKIEKNKESMKANEAKITHLNECQGKLEQIAKEMYNIESYENVQIEEDNEKQKEKKRQNLVKKCEVYEKVLVSNKKKYESELTRNEKVILELEEKKNSLLKEINEKGRIGSVGDSLMIGKQIKDNDIGKELINEAKTIEENTISHDDNKIQENKEVICNEARNEMICQVKEKEKEKEKDSSNDVQNQVIIHNQTFKPTTEENSCSNNQIKEEQPEPKKEDNSIKDKEKNNNDNIMIIKTLNQQEPNFIDKKKVVIVEENNIINKPIDKKNNDKNQMITPLFLRDSNAINEIASSEPLNNQLNKNPPIEPQNIPRKNIISNNSQTVILNQQKNQDSFVDEFDDLDNIII